MYSPFDTDLVLAHFQLKEADEALYRVQGSVKRKKILKYIFYILWGYLSCLALLVNTLSLVLMSSLYKKLHVRFMRYAWSSYFFWLGVTKYKTKPFPENLEKPKLIFTNRIHPFSSLFASLLFKFPVIIPISPLLKSFRFFPYLPSSFMSKNLPMISYPDETLANDLPTVHKLFGAGYSVIVYINNDYIDPKSMNSLPIHEEVMSLLSPEMEDKVETYFLLLQGMERLPFATRLSPIQIRCDLIKKEDLFYLIDPEDTKKRYKKIAAYFGFNYYSVVK